MNEVKATASYIAFEESWVIDTSLRCQHIGDTCLAVIRALDDSVNIWITSLQFVATC